ncbi:hypothetical protein IB223_17885 [Pseudoxanthomonas sp. PXM03]|uniref:hypothetical protein n=1 Tax=Pseudoxanthomonas sp. PXM03 TaxID=2769284 RepID=UPI00178496E1|nr:hypothetical protein [Pseudoxanthomonas sp. PXM03]MBD9437973.1 hypothetical protein [Pseudoxanthomonas sp. PXM03]
MKRLQTRLAIILLACLPGMAGAQASAHAAADTDEAKFVRLTRHLERFPLDPDAKPMRAWMLQWAIETPDLVITACDFLEPKLEMDSYYGGMLFMQILYGNAAWQIVHPEQRADPVAPQIAGVRSALKAYAEISMERADAQIPAFDTLALAERGGTLETSLTPRILQACRKDGATPTDDAST